MGPQSTTPTPRRALVLRTALALALAAPLVAQATAPLLLPSAIAYDAQGNLYIAEASRHDVRRLDPSGNVTTIAGTGTQGYSGDNGPAAAAELDSPQGIAVDATGNLYIADTHNHRIRKVNASTSIITTIAGTGAQGFSGDNGPAAAAELNLPTALAIDAQGNLYLADTRNHRIRKVNISTGIITTIAGTGTQGYSGDNGPATAAELDSPQGIAADAAGNLYLADTHNHSIRKIAASTGIISTIAGTGAAGNSGDSGPATAATLRLPRGVAIDAAGNLYLADYTSQSILKISAGTGQTTTIAGSGAQGFSGDGGPATIATLDSPRAAAISPTGLPTIADAANQRIRQLDSTGDIHTIAGPGATSPAGGAGTGSGSGSGTGSNITSTPVTITLAASSTSVTAGQAVTITATVSTPVGTPTGTVTLYDNSVALATIPLPPSGQIAYSTTALAAGANTLTATYSGDASYAQSISPAATVAVNTLSGTTTGGSDFTLSAKDATTQTLLPGSSASFTFALQTVGAALSSPITLSASGVPSLYTASFNPSYLPPGATNGTVTLTIAAQATNALKSDHNTSIYIAFLLFPSIFPSLLSLYGRNHPAKLAVMLACCTLVLLAGCGARINTAGQNTPAAIPYTITVTGTATTPAGTTLQHSTTITLLVQQST